MSALLEINSLEVSLGKRKVLDRVSLTVGPGEFVGLIGPNGAGKSTLVKSIFELVRSSGVISLNGRDSRLLSEAERAKLASYLPQEREIHWPIKARDLVALGRSFLGNSFDARSETGQQAIEKAMRRMDVLEFQERRATDLSGGERARVLIARALAQEAPLLMADEPVAGLDPAHQIGLMQRFSNLASDGNAVLACLHEISLASQWCSRLIVLDAGRIVADGKPNEVLTDRLMRNVYGVEINRIGIGHGQVVIPTRLCDEPDNSDAVPAPGISAGG